MLISAAIVLFVAGAGGAVIGPALRAVMLRRRAAVRDPDRK